MGAGGSFLNTLASLIQKTYNGGLETCFNELSPIYKLLNEKGLVQVDTRNYIRWPVKSSPHGGVVSIPDGGTLPAAQHTEFSDAYMTYKIILGTLRIGRLAQRGSLSEEFFKSAEGADALATEVDSLLKQMARTIHLQICALSQASTTDIDSLGDAVADITNVYAGLDRTTNAFWRPYVNSNGGTNRALTETLLRDMHNTLTKIRGAVIGEVWCGTTAWDALEDLLRGKVTVNNNDPKALEVGAQIIWWRGIPFYRIADLDENAMYWLDFISGKGIKLYRQHEDEFLVTPENTDSYDVRMSVACHTNFVVHNPWYQGALLDVQ